MVSENVLRALADSSRRRIRPREVWSVVRFAVELAWAADRRSLVMVAGAALSGPGGEGAAGGSGQLSVTIVGGVVVAALGLVAAVLGLVTQARKRVLDLKVQQAAAERVTRATAGVSLVDFERPSFHDRVRRAVEAAGTDVTLLHTVFAVVRAALATAAVVGALLMMA